MPTEHDLDNKIRVRISGDRLTATIQIAAGTQQASVDESTILGVAMGRGIPATDDLRSRIAPIVDEYDESHTEDLHATLAEGTPPRDGENGRFELAPDLLDIQERARNLRSQRLADPGDETEDTLDTDEEATDHYDRSTLLIVKPGQSIGQVIPCTMGTNGIDVCREPIIAKDGSETTTTFDEGTLRRLDDGNVVATIGGLLVLTDDAMRISDELEIDEYVDFSTGVINFAGSVFVRKGVRDCFVVESGKDLSVDDLVEAAELRSGRDVLLARGMAGREKGMINAGRDLKAKFIDACKIDVRRDLCIEREITNSHTVVWRNIESPGATMIGGECAVAGTASLGQIGTDSGSQTSIRLGWLGRIEQLVRDGLELYPLLLHRSETARNAVEQFQSNTVKLSTSQAETLAELKSAAAQAEDKLHTLRNYLDGAVKLVREHTVCSLTVQKKICAGTLIHAAGRVAKVTTNIPGPVNISLDASGQLITTQLATSNVTPLGQWASLDIDAGSVNPGDVNETLGLAA